MPAPKNIPAPSWPAVLLTALGVLLAFGLFGIFHMRLSGGHLYPAYSSLNPDSSGTGLLFDALTRTGKFLSVTREFRPANEISGRESIRQSTLLLLGYQPSLLENSSDGQLKAWEKLANLGNRVLVAVDSSGRLTADVLFVRRRPASGEPANPVPALQRLWQIRLEHASPRSAKWPLYFASAEGWTTLVADAGRPVVVTRSFGTEAVVLCAGSSPFTGKSLAENPQDHSNDELLARLMGSEPRVIFDEAHLGVVDTGSILSLARRYRLMGLLGGLVLLALAFVWNQAAGFPPSAESIAPAITGQDSRSGLLQLLRGQIPPARLIAACVSEWQRAHPASQVGGAIPKDPVAAYRAVQMQTIQMQTVQKQRL